MFKIFTFALTTFLFSLVFVISPVKVNAYTATASATPSATPSVDLTSPSVNITNPIFGSLVKGLINIIADAWDNVAVERVEFFVDGNSLGTGYSSPYFISWNTALEASDSSHILFARAFDTSGNEATSSAVWVTVDNTPPSVNLTNPLSSSLVSGIINLQVDAWDGVGLSKVDFYVDEVLVGSDFNYPYSAFWDTTGFVNNSIHTIYAKAYDKAGNVGISEVINVAVQDIISPQVSIISPANGSFVVKNSTVTILANAADISGIQKVEFYVNGVLKCVDVAAGYSCNWKVPVKKNVTYTLQAKAYDAAGNTAVNTISVTSK